MYGSVFENLSTIPGYEIKWLVYTLCPDKNAGETPDKNTGET